MFTIYVYVLDTLADWEIGNITAELNSRRFFKKDAQAITLKTVSCSKDSIKTMGGMTIVPDCTIEEMVTNQSSMLLLPGSDMWNDPKHSAIIAKANEFLEAGATVCAICGATVALASAGLLDNRPHTSNGPGFLDMFVPSYKGQSFYINEPAVTDDNLVTGSCTGGLLLTKLILEKLNVFSDETLKAWYDYFSLGKPEHFYALMQAVQEANK